MRAFVTGATGLLGNNLVRHLRERGHEVIGLVRSAEKASWLLGDTGARWVVGDMRDVAGFAASLDGCDVVFHTAAYFREYYQPGGHDEALDTINVKGTLALLDAADARGLRRFVHTSSSAIIGRAADGSPGDEDAPPDELVRDNGYVKSKVEGDAAIAAWRPRRGLEVVQILPGWMWGPGDAAPTGAGQVVLDFLGGRLPIVPAGGATTVDVRDVAAAMLIAGERAPAGARYLVAGWFVTLAEILRVLEQVTGLPGPRRRLPHALVWIFAALSELWGRVTGRPVLVSRAAIRMLRSGHAVSSARAERDLGVTFRPLEATVRDAVGWYRSEPRFAEKIAPKQPSAADRETMQGQVRQ
jgi:dihydroflavonol-4-reductase